MSENKPLPEPPSQQTEKKPKKFVRRSVAMALGIVCVILAAGLVGTIANYTSMVDNKDNTIASLNSQLSGQNAIIADQNNTIVSLNADIMNLVNEENQLQTWLVGNETLLSQTQTLLSENITSIEAQISSLNAQISQLESNNTILQSQVNNLTSIGGLATDPNLQAGLLLHLPAPASIWQSPDSIWKSLTTILLSLSLNQSEPGDQQSIAVPEGATITVTGEFQILNPSSGSSGDIRQVFFIDSWTPNWPVPNSNYYQPLFDDVPPTYPGLTQTFSFNLTVPNNPGLYYLFFCCGTQYTMQDAVNQYTYSPVTPHAVIIVEATA